MTESHETEMHRLHEDTARLWRSAIRNTIFAAGIVIVAAVLVIVAALR